MGFFSFTKRKLITFFILLGITFFLYIASFGCAFGYGERGAQNVCIPLEIPLYFLMLPMLIIPKIFYSNTLSGMPSQSGFIIMMVLQVLWSYLLTCLIDLFFRKKK